MCFCLVYSSYYFLYDAYMGTCASYLGFDDILDSRMMLVNLYLYKKSFLVIQKGNFQMYIYVHIFNDFIIFISVV